MMRKILITISNLSVSAELNNSVSADKIWEALPLSGSANVWGDEIYFEIPVSLKEVSDAQQEVEVGTLAYWPPGSALCVFFGKTPVSTNDKPKAYSPVNILGLVDGDSKVFKIVEAGDQIVIDKET
ncbi:MAG: cyclophilin-like fold protein [Candidatus Poribacteria bacterium]|nr:cyclophilin-like fold protein [Candidatus Poribacteria bacterium]